MLQFTLKHTFRFFRQAGLPDQEAKATRSSSSSSSSPDDHRPLLPSSSRIRIASKTVLVPLRSKLVAPQTASTPIRSNQSANGSVKVPMDTPDIRPESDTGSLNPVVDLTISSSNSGNPQDTSRT